MRDLEFVSSIVGLLCCSLQGPERASPAWWLGPQPRVGNVPSPYSAGFRRSAMGAANVAG